MNEDLERYRLIFEHFRQMEQRYHTWMNYYSLFNGALLVAYCTILVSTGRIVEKASYVMPLESNPTEGRELFSLECTYWEFLVLIAALGILAGFCWLRSMQGHRAWLGSWRNALRNEGQEFDHSIYVNANAELNGVDDQRIINRLSLYSTAEITIVFIGGVIASWFLSGIYAVWSVYSNLKEETSCLPFIFWIAILIVATMIGICCTKRRSDVRNFGVVRVPAPNETGNASLRSRVVRALEQVIRLLETFIR